MIKFGTDGWRARIADEFTFKNVALATQAFVRWLQADKLAGQGVAIGYDNRFQSESFAHTAAQVCAGAGLKVVLSDRAVSSPVISYTVKQRQLAAGIMITASHNPPEWNGFKIKENFGGSAFPQTTKKVEANLQTTLEIVPATASLKTDNLTADYFAKLKTLVDLDLIKRGELQLIFDPMHGSGAGYYRALGLPALEIRGQRDPLFGGVNPEPLPLNLEDTLSFVKDAALAAPGKLTTCIVVDGDADRVAAVDGSGQFINTHGIFTLLLHHLITHRKLSGNVVKTFNISNLVDKLCQQHRRQLHITPIGFKHVADFMLKEDILLGGEESGGMGIKGFIPERDGILAGLLLLELMAAEQKTLKQILDNIMNEHGYYYYDRADIQTAQAQTIVAAITKNPPPDFGGLKIARIENLDGLKFVFADESWILFRASGTEPLLRLYVEAKSPGQVKQLLGAGENLLPL